MAGLARSGWWHLAGGSVILSRVIPSYRSKTHPENRQPGLYSRVMLLRRDKTRMPTAADALPGRDEATEVQDYGHLVLGTPLKPPFPEGCERAMFGMGCFWGAERFFWQMQGVHTTAVGYSGGQTPNPTYQEVCSGRTGHNEVVLVVHDPVGGAL